MNAEFLGLACLAALNPKLLIVDLILATNRRPRMMFVFFLLGGMGLAITVGLLDVFVVHLDAVKTQNHASGGIDLALGVPLLIVGTVLATTDLHLLFWRHRSPSKERPPSKLQKWEEQVLHEPRPWVALLIGAVVGLPGATYLAALHHLVSSKTPAAVAVIAVLVFVTINFAPVLVPFAFYTVHPERTVNAIKRFEDWIASHERQLAAAIALLAGAYMVISGTVRVLS